MYVPKVIEPYAEMVTFPSFKRKCLIVRVEGEDYEACETASHNMWANKKTGTYGRGIANTNADKRKVERTGKLGDMAFAKIFGLTVDTEYREFGDDFDFILNQKTIDIKTAIRLPQYECGLVYAMNERGKLIPLKCDLYVFSFIRLESREDRFADVCIVGYTTKQYILGLRKKRARVGNHRNYEVPYQDLKRIWELLKGNMAA